MQSRVSSTCKHITQVSAVCHDMGYKTHLPSVHRHPDVLVAAVGEILVDKIQPTRVSPGCLSSIRTLSCSMVYEPCSPDTKDAGFGNRAPLHFSEM
ncbi:hypothetical protein GGI23_006043, partial [Coemansia sp. RSA 2559]